MDFDLAVIGTGVAAAGVATRVRRAGWSVAIIDERPFGGTCALRGCDPKKILVTAAEAVESGRRMRGSGAVGELKIDWRDLMAFKRSFTDPIPGRQEHRFRELGIATFQGPAWFVGSNSLLLAGKERTARHIIIASGAEPARLGIPGEEHFATSDQFMELAELPRRIVLVGGGYIAAEFSHIAARAGARVTVLQRGPRLLKRFEPELVGWLMEAFERIGVDVRTSTRVTGIEQTATGYRVTAERAGQSDVVEADLVVHAAGRVPAIDRLALDAADIAVEDGRLKLNDFLQSVSNPAVYAAGDAAQAGPPLTPISSHDAKVVAANLLEGNHRRPDYRGVPSVAFTLPPIAAVGLSEEEARRSGVRHSVKSERTSGWFTARRVNEKVYGYKTLVDEDSGRLLGAHLVGPHADEVINLFGLAIRHDLKVDDLESSIFAYPTGGSDIGYMV